MSRNACINIMLHILPNTKSKRFWQSGRNSFHDWENYFLCFRETSLQEIEVRAWAVGGPRSSGKRSAVWFFKRYLKTIVSFWCLAVYTCKECTWNLWWRAQSQRHKKFPVHHILYYVEIISGFLDEFLLMLQLLIFRNTRLLTSFPSPHKPFAAYKIVKQM